MAFKDMERVFPRVNEAGDFIFLTRISISLMVDKIFIDHVI